MEASERIIKLLDENGISPYKLSKDLGISKSNFTGWNNNPTSKIGGDIIVKIANYFHVSCDYLLLGKETNEHKTAREAMALLPYKDLISAYRSADRKSRNIVNTTLDLPVEK